MAMSSLLKQMQQGDPDNFGSQAAPTDKATRDASKPATPETSASAIDEAAAAVPSMPKVVRAPVQAAPKAVISGAAPVVVEEPNAPQAPIAPPVAPPASVEPEAAPVKAAPQAESVAPAAAPVTPAQAQAGTSAPERKGPGAMFDTPEDDDDTLVNNDGGDGMVTCGDAEVPAQLKKEPQRGPRFAGEAFADGDKIPPRPNRWPVMMSWPPRRDVEILNREDVTPAQRAKYFAELMAREQAMMKRADKIHEWILTHGGPASRRDKKHLERLATDPYNGIRWATLLDAKASAHASTAAVARWSHTGCETIDGGKVRATDAGVRVTKATKQSIDMAIREGIARGWNTFEFKGNREFVKLAVQACREANIEATITLNPALVPGIPGLGFRRKFKIMPNIPGFEEIHPGTKAAAEQEGTPENEGREMKSDLKQKLEAARKAREEPKAKGADADDADDVLENLDRQSRGPSPDNDEDPVFA